MLKMYTATIRDGALVLPEGADLGLSREGERVQVAVEVADALDKAGLAFAATRPGMFREQYGDRPELAGLPRAPRPPVEVAAWPAEQTAGLRSPRNAPGEADKVTIGPRAGVVEDGAAEAGDAGPKR